MPLQIVIANRLGDGRVVYLGAGAWIETLSAAERAEAKTPAAAALLARAEESVKRNEIVDPYLADIVEDAAGIRLARLREHIRSLGPTVRPDLGYQAGEVS
jgi:hypothetical protein